LPKLEEADTCRIHTFKDDGVDDEDANQASVHDNGIYAIGYWENDHVMFGYGKRI